MKIHVCKICDYSTEDVSDQALDAIEVIEYDECSCCTPDAISLFYMCNNCGKAITKNEDDPCRLLCLDCTKIYADAYSEQFKEYELLDEEWEFPGDAWCDPSDKECEACS